MHTRSLVGISKGVNYSRWSGFHLVVWSDVIITTYSSMAKDALLLGKGVIWPRFLGHSRWTSAFENSSNFCYADTLDEVIHTINSIDLPNETIDDEEGHQDGRQQKISDFIIETAIDPHKKKVLR